MRTIAKLLVLAAAVVAASGTGDAAAKNDCPIIPPPASPYFNVQVKDISCFRATTIALDWEDQVPCHGGRGETATCRSHGFKCTSVLRNPPGRTYFEKVKCTKGAKYLKFNYGQR